MSKQDNNMSADDNNTQIAPENLPEAALRALAEAKERRKNAAYGKNTPPRELGGRGGHDPARYGDWEIKGRAIDF